MLLEVKLVRLRQGFTIDATHNAAIVDLVIALVKAPIAHGFSHSGVSDMMTLQPGELA